MEENIDIVDETEKATGKTISKDIAHKNGILHQAAHIWIYNSKGEILLQKRAHCKKNHPGLWDISAGGHLSVGETPDAAALRELEEELGLKVGINDLEKVFVRRSSCIEPENNYHNEEFHHVYLLKWDGLVKDLELQCDEVECLKFVPIKKFEFILKTPEEYRNLVPHEDYYKEIIDAVKKRIVLSRL